MSAGTGVHGNHGTAAAYFTHHTLPRLPNAALHVVVTGWPNVTFRNARKMSTSKAASEGTPETTCPAACTSSCLASPCRNVAAALARNRPSWRFSRRSSAEEPVCMSSYWPTHFFDFDVRRPALPSRGRKVDGRGRFPSRSWKRISPVRRASFKSPDPLSRSTLPFSPSTV